LYESSCCLSSMVCTSCWSVQLECFHLICVEQIWGEHLALLLLALCIHLRGNVVSTQVGELVICTDDNKERIVHPCVYRYCLDCGQFSMLRWPQPEPSNRTNTCIHACRVEWCGMHVQYVCMYLDGRCIRVRVQIHCSTTGSRICLSFV